MFPKPGKKPKQKAPMKRSKLPPKNKPRALVTHEEDFGGGINHDFFIRKQPCLICVATKTHQVTGTDAAHVRARSVGGRWYQTVPLCRLHHQEQGQIGTAGVLASYGVDLHAEAKRLTLAHMTELGAV